MFNEIRLRFISNNIFMHKFTFYNIILYFYNQCTQFTLFFLCTEHIIKSKNKSNISTFYNSIIIIIIIPHVQKDESSYKQIYFNNNNLQQQKINNAQKCEFLDFQFLNNLKVGVHLRIKLSRVTLESKICQYLQY